MKVELTPVTSLEEALALAPRLDDCAAASLAEFSDDPFPAGATERFLRRHFDADETVLVVARVSNGDPVGLCLVGPFEDPLTAVRVPMVLTLHVATAWRHRGVARSLVSEAQSQLVGRGQTKLAARAGHNDDALISMGERWGFVRLWELMLLE